MSIALLLLVVAPALVLLAALPGLLALLAGLVLLTTLLAALAGLLVLLAGLVRILILGHDVSFDGPLDCNIRRAAPFPASRDLRQLYFSPAVFRRYAPLSGAASRRKENR